MKQAQFVLAAALAALALPSAAEDCVHVKVHGAFAVNDMLKSYYSPDAYTFAYNGIAGIPSVTSESSAKRWGSGYGAGIEWSPNEIVWVEFSYQTTPRLQVFLQTSVVNRFQPADEVQRVYADFHANDFSLVLKGDAARSSKYVSALFGAGIHKRYIRHASGVYYWDPRKSGRPNNGDFSTERLSQARLLGTAEVELYPAGKDKHVGIGLSARILCDGRKAVPAELPSVVPDGHVGDRVFVDIHSGFYDVTARIVIRF